MTLSGLAHLDFQLPGPNLLCIGLRLVDWQGQQQPSGPGTRWRVGRGTGGSSSSSSSVTYLGGCILFILLQCFPRILHAYVGTPQLSMSSPAYLWRCRTASWCFGGTSSLHSTASVHRSSTPPSRSPTSAFLCEEEAAEDVVSMTPTAVGGPRSGSCLHLLCMNRKELRKVDSSGKEGLEVMSVRRRTRNLAVRVQLAL